MPTGQKAEDQLQRLPSWFLKGQGVWESPPQGRILGAPSISILNPGIRIFLENLRTPGGKSWFLQRTMVAKNGIRINPSRCQRCEPHLPKGEGCQRSKPRSQGGVVTHSLQFPLRMPRSSFQTVGHPLPDQFPLIRMPEIELSFSCFLRTPLPDRSFPPQDAGDRNRTPSQTLAPLEAPVPRTIFFSDIANFTTIAESLEPEAFMAMLSTPLDLARLVGLAVAGGGRVPGPWWRGKAERGEGHVFVAEVGCFGGFLQGAPYFSRGKPKETPLRRFGVSPKRRARGCFSKGDRSVRYRSLTCIGFLLASVQISQGRPSLIWGCLCFELVPFLAFGNTPNVSFAPGKPKGRVMCSSFAQIPKNMQPLETR